MMNYLVWVEAAVSWRVGVGVSGRGGDDTWIGAEGGILNVRLCFLIASQGFLVERELGG